MNKKGQAQMTGACMRGGIDIDESTLSDNANYWTMGAKWATKEAERRVRCTHDVEDECRVWKIQRSFWNPENSWKTICLKSERMRDLIKLLVKE